MSAPARRARKHVRSIQDAPISARPRIADEDESVEDRDARRARNASPFLRAPEPELDLGHQTGATSSHRPVSISIEARIHQGWVEFRVFGKDEPVTFDELAAACAEQFPGVVLERRTKWLQYTFDLWAHAGQCLYSIPIASMPAPEAPAAAAAPRKPRRHLSELAAHHPRG